MGSPLKEVSSLDHIMNKETEGRDTGNSSDAGEQGGGDGSQGNNFILVMIHRDGASATHQHLKLLCKAEREALQAGQRGINQRHTSRL